MAASPPVTGGTSSPSSHHTAPSISDVSGSGPSLTGVSASSAANPSAASAATNTDQSLVVFDMKDPAESSSRLDRSSPDADTHMPSPHLHGTPPNPNPNHGDKCVPPQRTYVAATNDKSTRPPPAFVTNLTTFHPVKRGNSTFLRMPDALYQKRLSAFNYALIGRIFLPKQTQPRALPDLKSELQQLFQTTGDWSLNPLGKEFYSLKFANQADQSRASHFTSWRLKTGNFHIHEWKPNFDPYKEQTSITQIWVRLFHLPEEYWDPDFLVGIFRAVGNVVKLDESTAAGLVGHFARALIEVDLSYPLAEGITIECGQNSFAVEFGYENIPLFCSFYRYIGHSIADCKSKKKMEAAPDQPAAANSAAVNPNPGPKRKRKGKNWQPVAATIPTAKVTTSNSFAALGNQEDMESAPLTRELVPLSDEAAKAIEGLKNKDFFVDPPYDDDVLSSDGEDVEEIPAPGESADKVGNPPSPVPLQSLPFTNAGLSELAQRIDRLSSHSVLSRSHGKPHVEEKLKQLYSTGATPNAYSIEPGIDDSLKAMSNVTSKNWSAAIDDATVASKPSGGSSSFP